MFPGRVEDSIIRESLDEVASMFKWARERIGSGTGVSLILVGGWAVDACNSWYGSRDIDIMVNSKGGKKLSNYLNQERGFQKQRDKNGLTRLIKSVHGEEIIIDFVKKKQEYRGTPDVVEYRFDDSDLNTIQLRNAKTVVVPNKSRLLLMKIKAAWDRSGQLEEGVEYNRGYVESKFIKDCGDIIALLDPKFGQDKIMDLGILSE